MILVIGQNGYLGSLLVSSESGNQIIRPPIPKLSRILYDSSTSQLSEMGIDCGNISDVVIAASKPKLEKWSVDDMHSNIQIVQGVVRHFRNSRIIFLSTIDVYGHSPTLPITESSDLTGNTLYAKSKLRSEKILQENFPSDKLAIFRLPGVYGGSVRAHGLMDLFVRNIRNHQPIVLDSEDVLAVKRDWIYGPDIVELLNKLLLSNKFRGGTYNLVNGKAFRIREWISHAERIAGSSAKLELRNPMVHHEIFDLIFDDRKLRAFFPEFSSTAIEDSFFP